MSEALSYNELFLSTATQRLKVFCYALIICSSTCLLLILLLLISATGGNIGLVAILTIAICFIEVFLAIVVSGLIKDAGYSRTPLVKKQFIYLLLLYLSVFCLILHGAFVYRLFFEVKFLYRLLPLISGWQQLYISIFVMAAVLNSILLPTVQIMSFKFVKLLRRASIDIESR